LGWVQFFSLVVGWVGLELGSHKMDPRTTLIRPNLVLIWPWYPCRQRHKTRMRLRFFIRMTDTRRVKCFIMIIIMPLQNKKLCCRKRTARRGTSAKIFSIVATICTTNPPQIESTLMVTVDRLVVNSNDLSIVVQMSSTNSIVDDCDC